MITKGVIPLKKKQQQTTTTKTKQTKQQQQQQKPLPAETNFGITNYHHLCVLVLVCVEERDVSYAS